MSNSLYFILGFLVAFALFVTFCYLVFVFTSEDKFYLIEYFKFDSANKKYIAIERVKNLKFKKNYIKFITKDNIHVRVNYVYYVSSEREVV